MSVTNLATREDMINVDLDKQKLTRGNGIKLLGYHDMVGDVIGIRAFKDGQPFDLMATIVWGITSCRREKPLPLPARLSATRRRSG